MIVPGQIKRELPTQLKDFVSPVINTYSLETTIAEKLDAILFLMEFSSRMKDYYDIYYLAGRFDFDGETLTKALQKTFENREHSFTAEGFESIITFGGNEAMTKKWNAFCRKLDMKTGDYKTVLTVIDNFLSEPYSAAINKCSFTGKWSASSGKWN